MQNVANSTATLLDYAADQRGACIPLRHEQQSSLSAFRGARLPEAANPCLCGAADDLLVADRDRYGLTLRTVLCQACGLLRSDPCLGDDALLAFYREHYRPLYLGHYEPADLFREQAVRGTRILRWLSRRGLRPGRVLEIGAATGGTMRRFEEQGWDAAGCDHDARAVAHGRDCGVDIQVGGLETLRRREPADLVVLLHVLEHLRDPIARLREASQLLRPGGALYIEVPGIHRIRHSYRSVGRSLHVAHLWHFTRRTLDFVCTRAGLVPVTGDEVVRGLYRRPVDSERPDPHGVDQPDPRASREVLRRLRSVERWRWCPRPSRGPALVSRALRSLLGGSMHQRLRHLYWAGTTR